MRQSIDEYQNGRLMDGFDYENQAWVVDGRYVRCGHTAECDCYGRQHEGQQTIKRRKTDAELLAECDALDAVYAHAAEMDAQRAAQMPEPEDEDLETFDPVRDGWVDHRGRP